MLKATKFVVSFVLLIALAACTVQSPAPLSQGQPSGTSTAQAPISQDNRQTTPPAQPQNPVAKQTASNNLGSPATQNLDLNVPAHPIDIILGRPTQHSITVSVLAYQDSEGFLEFGTQPGVHPGKTPLRQFPKGQPVEVLIDSLQPDTQYYYQFLYRTASSGEFTAVEDKAFHTQRGSNSTFTFTIQAG